MSYTVLRTKHKVTAELCFNYTAEGAPIPNPRIVSPQNEGAVLTELKRGLVTTSLPPRTTPVQRKPPLLPRRNTGTLLMYNAVDYSMVYLRIKAEKKRPTSYDTLASARCAGSPSSSIIPFYFFNRRYCFPAQLVKRFTLTDVLDKVIVMVMVTAITPCPLCVP